MKRKLAIVMAFMLILVMAAPAFAAVNLDINGKAYPLSSEPSLNNGITAMPLEEVSTALECSAACFNLRISSQGPRKSRVVPRDGRWGVAEDARAMRVTLIPSARS